jgi:hypothetical protein
MNIAIPSYQRPIALREKTLRTLAEHGIPKEQIHIFVVKDEEATYKEAIGSEYNIVVGELGLVEQKRFIESYYPEAHHIVFMDDDIEAIDLDAFSTLTELIETAHKECLARGAYIWSVYPVWNPYFRKTKETLSTSLKMCIGGFTGIINRPNNVELHLKWCRDREDVERTLRYFIHDGIVLRFNRVGYKTKFFNDGGLGTLKERIDRITSEVQILSDKFPLHGSIRQKKEYPDFRLNAVPARPKDQKEPIQLLPEIKESRFDLLRQLLKSHTVKLCSPESRTSRLGFGRHRAEQYGVIRARFQGTVGLSAASRKHPEIHDEIMRIGREICPFDFTSVQLNNNTVCPLHCDSKNVGSSLLISFGDYTGCNIVIDGTMYDARYKPIIFNGSEREHWNTDDLVGNKYSLVFYRNKETLAG